MRERASRLERSAEDYERGAEGERATAVALSALPGDEWTVFHDIRWPGRRFANVDHVVVGPPGVFVVDSKNWSGRLEVRDDALLQNGRRRETAVEGAAEAALAVSSMTHVVAPQLVVPVLCFTRGESVTGWARDVMLCSTANVVEMLMTRERKIDAVQRQQLCLDLDASFRPALQPAEVASGRRSKSPLRSRARVQADASRRKSSARSGLATLAGLLVVGGLLLGGMATNLPQEVGKAFVSLFVDDNNTTPSPTDPGDHHAKPERKSARN